MEALPLTEHAPSRRRNADPGGSALRFVGGLVLTTAFHAFVGIGLYIAGALPDTVEPVVPIESERPMIEFVEARLLRLGREFHPREMPNRLRATRSTGPAPLARTPTKQAQRVRREPQEVPTPANAVDDLIARLGQSASEHARIAEESEREGSLEGVEEGTETEGNAAQAYRGQLYMFFRRGFQMPTSISEQERHGLGAVVMVRSSPSGVVEGFDLRSSGNAEFDQAVRLRMSQAVGSPLPTPPTPELRDEFFGASFPIRFSPPR